jgi:hypothetical protein
MSDTWTISVAGRSYGPYTASQMHAFCSEGRLAPHSLVARTGEQQHRPASEDPDLMPLFAAASPQMNERKPESPSATPRFGRLDRDENKTGERSQFVIVAHMRTRSVQALEEEIFNLGPTFPVLPQVWILATEASVNTVRNALVQKLGKLDMLFVVDATHNKAAWFNFGPEADARIRKIWQRSTSDATATPRRAAE